MAKAASQQSHSAPAEKPHDAFVVETYVDKPTGEEKKRYHQIGTVWKHKSGEGQTLQIIPGVSVSGDIVIFPRKDKKPAESAGH